MKDIEVGEYVRTKNGIIDKVERFSVGCCVWYCENGMCIDECNCIGTQQTTNRPNRNSEIL